MTLGVDLLIGPPGAARNLKDERDIKLSLTRDLHGDSRVTFDLCDWTESVPKLRSLVAIRDSVYGYVWSGYMARPQMPGFFGGPVSMEARGWRNTIGDHCFIETKIWAEGTPLTNVVQEAQTLMTHVGAGIPIPGGLAFQLSEASPDFLLRSPEDVFTFVSDKFKHLTTPLIWEVRQNHNHRHNNDPSFYMRFADFAPRYFVKLTKDDEFKPSFDSDTIFNRAAVGWSPKLAEETVAAPAQFAYSVIPHLRTKRVNGSTSLNTEQEAMALGQFLVQRNNILRPSNTILRISCNTPIRAVFPVVPSQTPSVPHWNVLSNFVIRIENDMTDWFPYIVRDYWISDVTYDFESGNLSLSVGDPIEYDNFELQQSYQVSRVNSALDSGIVNEPLRDADTIPVYGPDKAGDSPPTIGEGIDMHYLDQNGNLQSVVDINKPSLRHGAVVHPTLIPDYGVQANFGREADRVGTKGFIRVIPCKVWDWTLDFTPPAGSDVIPVDNITVQLYPTYPFVVDTSVLATCTIAAGSSNSGAITPSLNQVFAQGGKIGVRVSIPATTSGCGFQVGIGGKKIYPDLGVNT